MTHHERRTRAAIGALVALALAAPGAMVAPPDATAAEETAGAIVIGLALPPFASNPFIRMSNAYGVRPPSRADIVPQLVYNAVYRYDDSLEPVPDLAAEPCTVLADQVTIRCSLVEATFHDGSALTADDVAFTYEMGRRAPDCMFGFGDACLGDVLDSASAIDSRTVEFKLRDPDARFLTLALPSVLIDSRAVVEAAFAPLAERAATLDPSEFERVAGSLAQQLGSDAPDCEAHLQEADALLLSTGLEVPPRDRFLSGDGSFDACVYAREIALLLSDIAASLQATGPDAIALAYRALPFNLHPVGTGPWRFTEVQDGNRAVFDAFEDYWRGRPATPRVEVQVYRSPAAIRDDLLRDEIDWVTLPPALYETVDDAPGLRYAVYPDAAIHVLAYNLRPGMVFADAAARSAVELCIDKPATVDAATDGSGDVIYSHIDPISWAYAPDLRHPLRDVSTAREMLEAAGWTPGPDGIYVRDGTRLAADVYVRADDEQRVKFLDLVAAQVHDCGIEFDVVGVDPFAVLGPLLTYPHVAPGSDEPFQAVFLALGHGYDPADEFFDSRYASSEQDPEGINFTGFADPVVDRLVQQGIATYDQRERARIYRELQGVIADAHPVLFAWSPRTYDAIDDRLALTDGTLDLSSRQWWWQLEKLVLPPP